MSSNEKVDDELKDVDMCYKGMGIPFDSSPNEVEKAYSALTEKFKKDLLSADPAKRLKAKEDAEIVNNLYDKIRNSVNYQRNLRERSSAPDEKERAQIRKTETPGPKIISKICPSCNNMILKALKVCPICKKRIYSSYFEKVWVENFTSKNILLTLSILSCLVLVILIAINFGEIIRFINHLKK
jgi:hypothetical protein